MLAIIRRLTLGISLIALAAAVLLITDWSHRHPVKSKIPRIAIFQFANNQLLDDGLAGVIEGLSEHGYTDGKTIRIESFNAQGDLPTANSISRTIVEGGYDL